MATFKGKTALVISGVHETFQALVVVWNVSFTVQFKPNFSWAILTLNTDWVSGQIQNLA